MKENKFGVGARRAMHLTKERGHLTLIKHGKDAKKFHIGRVKAVEKNSAKEAVLIFGSRQVEMERNPRSSSDRT